MNYLFFIFLITILFLIYVEYSVGNVIYRITSSGIREIHLSNIINYLLEPLHNSFLWNYKLLDVNYIFVLGVSTIFYWIQRGQEDKEGIYHKFFRDYKKAKSSLMLKHLMIINKAAENDWRASRYVLESQFGLVPQYKPEVEINISVDQVDTKELIEQLRKTDELLNLKGPIIDIQEE